MITPVFNIKQDDGFLIITVRAPYANIAETEVEYGEKEFAFSSQPYFLRLYLPADVVDDNTGTTSYNADDGIFTITVPKREKGQFFAGLDMINELLRPQRISAKRMVEEIEKGDGGEGDEEQLDSDDDQGADCLMDQHPTMVGETPTDEVAKVFGYGFAWRRHGILGKFAEDIGMIVDLPNVEKSPIQGRVEYTANREKTLFDKSRYLADTFDSDDYEKQLVEWKLPEALNIDMDDTERLKNLPNIKLPRLSLEEEYTISLSLVDILFAFAYDLRMTEGEGSVESSWTITRLSASLHSFVRWECAAQAVESCMRRALVFPLYRSWRFAEVVWRDAVDILKRGRSAIVHCLCMVHKSMVEGGEFRYLFNDLLLIELILFVQIVHDEVLSRLVEEVSGIHPTKEFVHLGLEELELEGMVKNMEMVDSDE